MDVLYGATSIVDGDTTPSLGEGTDFGSADISGGTVTHTLTIKNTGSAVLNLTGSPKATVGGTNAADFTVTMQPSSPGAVGGGSTTFSVTFAPSGVGVRTATLSIANDDSDENSYDFSIQGQGITAGAEWFVDNRGGAPGYVETGPVAWNKGAFAGGYLGNYRHHTTGTGANKATWTLTCLTSGTYEVAVRWVATVPTPPTPRSRSMIGRCPRVRSR